MSRTSTVDFPHKSIRMLLLDRQLARENAHRLDDSLATIAEDAVFEDLALAMQWTGRPGAAAHYRMWWDGFDLVISLERSHLADASTIAETTWRGTHIGEFFGVAPTGRTIELPVVIVVDFEGGMLAGERFYWDRATLAAQLDMDDPFVLGPSPDPVAP